MMAKVACEEGAWRYRRHLRRGRPPIPVHRCTIWGYRAFRRTNVLFLYYAHDGFDFRAGHETESRPAFLFRHFPTSDKSPFDDDFRVHIRAMKNVIFTQMYKKGGIFRLMGGRKFG